MFFLDDSGLEFAGPMPLIFLLGFTQILLIPAASILSYLLRRKRFSNGVDEVNASTTVENSPYFNSVFYRYQGKYWRSEIESKYLQDGQVTLLVNPMEPNRVIAKPSIAKDSATKAYIVLTLLVAGSAQLLNVIYNATQKQGFQTWLVNAKEVIRTLEVWIYTGSKSEFMLSLDIAISVFIGFFALIVFLPFLSLKMGKSIKQAFDGSRGQLAQQATTQEFNENTELTEAA